MTDITQHLPKQSKTVATIFAKYKEVGDAEPVRDYLGASIIGHPCERYLWYCFRQCCRPKFNGRMYRLFHTGDLAEERFVNDLRMIGCEVYDCDQDGEQFAVSAFRGHFSGHMDGCVLGIPEAPKTWHVLEFKTHNAASFHELKKDGVKKSKPKHYAQMIIYMHLSGMTRALYIAVNKDDDDLHSERIRYDKTEAEALMDRAKRIITATTPPERIAGREDYYLCSRCDARRICWGSSDSALPIPSLSCRHCCHATPLMDGVNAGWDCAKHEAPAICDEPCKDHLILPGLVSFAEPTDWGQDKEGKDFIEFTNEDGTTWKTGPAYGCYSSEELTKLPATSLANGMIQSAKETFGATVASCEQDILSRYPEEDSRIIWKGNYKDIAAAWRNKYNEDLTKLKPIARFDNPFAKPSYDSAEMEGGRVVIVWGDDTAEIREGLE